MKQFPGTSSHRIAAIAFGAAAIMALVFFEVRTSALASAGPVVLVPYGSFVLIAVLLAVRLSRWYLPETGYFEAIAVPFLVSIISAMVAGTLYATAILLADSGSEFSGRSDMNIFAAGFYAGFLFLYLAWPALLPAMAAASVLVWKRRDRFSGLDAV